MILHLGIDPGTSNFALNVVARDLQRWRLVHMPVLNSLDELAEWLRCFALSLGSNGSNEAHTVWSVTAEKVSFAHRNDATEKVYNRDKAAEILRSVGMAQLFAKMVGARFIELADNTWKKRIAGNGRATKEEARKALRVICSGVPKVFGLNRSDAACLAIAGAMEVRG